MNAQSAVPAFILLVISAFSQAAEQAVPATELAIPSTRVVDPGVLANRDSSGYAYRRHLDLILVRMDLRPGDNILDLGAGDGWWTAHFAQAVGPTGVVYAAEITPELVERLKSRFHDLPWVKPYLCPKVRPGLPEESVDLVFLSQVYHHLESKSRINYWKELERVVKPAGRVIVIETYPQIATQGQSHGTPLGVLISEAEQGGWVAGETWYIPQTQHYFAAFLKRSLFIPAEEKSAPEVPTNASR